MSHGAPHQRVVGTRYGTSRRRRGRASGSGTQIAAGAFVHVDPALVVAPTKIWLGARYRPGIFVRSWSSSMKCMDRRGPPSSDHEARLGPPRWSTYVKHAPVREDLHPRGLVRVQRRLVDPPRRRRPSSPDRVPLDGVGALDRSGEHHAPQRPRPAARRLNDLVSERSPRAPTIRESTSSSSALSSGARKRDRWDGAGWLGDVQDNNLHIAGRQVDNPQRRSPAKWLDERCR